MAFVQAYDTAKTLIYAVTPNRTSKELTISEYAAAGFLSAIPSTLVTAPVERAKVLLQVCIPTVTSQCRFSKSDRCKVRARADHSTTASSTS